MDSASFNAFEQAQAQLDRIADLMGLDSGARTLLRSPMHDHRFTLPVHMDDHRLEVFQAFRIVHCDARGPALGGVRFHPMETVDTVRGHGHVDDLADGVGGPSRRRRHGRGCLRSPHPQPLGAGTGRQNLDRRLVRSLGPCRDVPSPDIMTSAQHMGWMLTSTRPSRGAPARRGDRQTAHHRRLQRAGRGAGYGLVYVLREALRN